MLKELEGIKLTKEEEKILENLSKEKIDIPIEQDEIEDHEITLEKIKTEGLPT